MDAPDLHLGDEEIVFELEDVTGVDDPDLALARADIAAGRVVPHEQVVEWLRTWGKGPRQPPPRPWLK